MPVAVPGPSCHAVICPSPATTRNNIRGNTLKIIIVEEEEGSISNNNYIFHTNQINS